MKPNRPPSSGVAGTVPAYGRLLRRTHWRFSRAMSNALTERGLVLGQFRLLRVLFVENGLTQRELSDRVEIEQGALTNLFRSMEADGLIERRRDSTDGRKIEVFLTPRSQRLRATLLPLAEDVNRRACSGISRRDLATTIRVLNTMAANLTAVKEP